MNNTKRKFILLMPITISCFIFALSSCYTGPLFSSSPISGSSNSNSSISSSSPTDSSSSTGSNISEGSITITADKVLIRKNESVTVDWQLSSNLTSSEVSLMCVNDESLVLINGAVIKGLKAGTAKVVATNGDVRSNEIELFVVDDDNDPYKNTTFSQFYSTYTKSTSLAETYYRNKHNFMSGSIAEQDQVPSTSQNQPKESDKFVRNSSANYIYNYEAYNITDSSGRVVNTIYKDGGYVTLEEVAAYVYAFGDVPANYVNKKSAKPSSSPWKQYLRLNNSYFSGDTTNFPYEPEFPGIMELGGNLKYYEIDIGTTGTDCDPNYVAAIYNNGSKITRGAARIIYTRTYADNSEIEDLNQKYVFYTYNHYNDFQEYLNYEGGWGEMFGNITGGGTISSGFDYNPTPYVPVIQKELVSAEIAYSLYYTDNRKYFC